LGLDEWADKLVQNSGRGDKLVLFETGEWITPRKLEFHEIAIRGETKPNAKPEEGHHHGNGDPHYWHDPRRAMQVVARIAVELSKLDPAHKDAYDQRATDYIPRCYLIGKDGKIKFASTGLNESDFSEMKRRVVEELAVPPQK
jgi:ABC-type Zn uptake system ZnuABC Zn-binding protein ZnuA